jgi:hypothetical protein
MVMKLRDLPVVLRVQFFVIKLDFCNGGLSMYHTGFCMVGSVVLYE